MILTQVSSKSDSFSWRKHKTAMHHEKCKDFTRRIFKKILNYVWITFSFLHWRLFLQIVHHGADSVNFTTVNQSGVVSVTEYYRPQRTAAEVRLLRDTAQPGISYPVYTAFVTTNFTCLGQSLPGWFVEPQTFCQQYYYCREDAKFDTYLCPPGTIFSAATQSCDAWYNVVCNGHVLLNSTTYATAYLLQGQVTNGIVTSGQGNGIVPSGGNRNRPSPSKFIANHLKIIENEYLNSLLNRIWPKNAGWINIYHVQQCRCIAMDTFGNKISALNIQLRKSSINEQESKYRKSNDCVWN